jgi:hypothetical protein
MKCAICGDIMIIDHPDNIYDRNPETFRFAWMHFLCYRETFEQLKHEPTQNPIYNNKQDEFLTRFN